MGVPKLWELLAPAGRNVTLESLSHKRLAIDTSIWLVSLEHAYQDESGRFNGSAALKGLFMRLCKLIFYQIKPVFVFDGASHHLKRKTLELRRKRQKKVSEGLIKKLAQKIFNDQLKKREMVNKPFISSKPRAKKAKEEEIQLIEHLSSPPAVNDKNLKSLKEEKRKTEGNWDFESNSSEIIDLDGPSNQNQSKEEYKDANELIDLSNLSEKERLEFESDFYGNQQVQNRKSNIEYEMNTNALEEILSPEKNLLDLLPSSIDRNEFNKLPVSVQLDTIQDIKHNLKQQMRMETTKKLQKKSTSPSNVSNLQISNLLKRNQINKKVEEAKQVLLSSDTSESPEFNRVISEKDVEYSLQRNPDNLHSNLSKSAITPSSENVVESSPSSNPLSTPLSSSKFSRLFPNDNMNNNNNNNNESQNRELSSPLNSNLSLKKLAASTGKSLSSLVFGSRNREASSPSPSKLSSESLYEKSSPKKLISDLLNAKKFVETIGGDEEDDESSEEELIVRKKKKPTARKLDLELSPVKQPEKKNIPEEIIIEDDEKMENSNDNNINENNFENETEEFMGGFINDDEEEEEESVLDLNKEEEDKNHFNSGEGDSSEAIFGGGFIPDEEDDKEEDEEEEELLIIPEQKKEIVDLDKEEQINEYEDEEFGENEIRNEEENEMDADKIMNEMNNFAFKFGESAASLFSQPKPQSLKERDVINISDSEEDRSWKKRKTIQIDDEDEFEDVPLSGTLYDYGNYKNNNNNNNNNINSGMQDPRDALLLSLRDGEVEETRKRNIKSNKSKEEEEEDFWNNLDPSIFEQEESIDIEDQKMIQSLISKDLESRFKDSNEDPFKEMEIEALLLSEMQRKEQLTNSTIDSVFGEIVGECQELLHFFGVPYVVAPFEAESQCAYLCLNGLVDGIVTDDSDVFLFGGDHIYRNMFKRDKYVESYHLKDIKSEVGLDRISMVQLALLLGSDYTDGVKGVGIVHGMEIINTFGGGADCLVKFREFLEKGKEEKEPEIKDEPDATPQRKKEIEELRKKREIRDKLLKLKNRIDLEDDFPDEEIITAYIDPDVEHSLESFEWSAPNLDSIRQFAMRRFEWDKEKCDYYLLPIEKEMNRMKEGSDQRQITSYFERGGKLENKINSARVQNVIAKMTGKKVAVEEKESKQEKKETKPKEKKKVSPNKKNMGKKK
eukprot:TRINITY_DN1859_c0_g1_i1.p1 TRINITY_DN1859_c0_g1~~TRINITY_DN1859_c0_g1_i1.p1  ORF type:complete len:1182 (+),score=541.09 TRINITY_DN1859_c0_g1_i1:84-3629(+)